MASNNHLKQLSCHPHVASDLSTALRVPSDTTERIEHKRFTFVLKNGSQYSYSDQDLKRT